MSEQELYTESMMRSEIIMVLKRTSKCNEALSELLFELERDDPDEKRIENLVWRANEMIHFAESNVRDDRGVVKQFKELYNWEP